ncbi:MAG: PTS glucose transporter subunit IIA [Clostridium baratii]|uniref:Glucose-specific phosphotransferase enzyme IIA component n=1 Tax=Clostridium baratii str. Sullivan TaxID=1415775 RepID=A0A0A7FVV7_9CLOT|nr:PTS glucose transporter subunit IIA [Clostridium baratii]AIY83737.1 glucose-specific phosphotransferase enzyme IIA component [Clostridium baratii str. Sullivan]MBS6008006.1 PTS glucose transporter subunit IIA [Clostridium baratii]MDU1054968.1 PTS glucose transporter subunit IIA [Clostridium baratii]CUP76225.1 PTS system%2C glucose subfamily%2C IIA component [Clostridium baratii]
MFGLFKKNKTEKKDTLNFVAPVDGKTMDLSEVPDPVFAQKMAGDGLAIDATGDIIVAPCDGDLTLVFKTKHAFAMTLDNGIELLVHIGIETVSLNGEGFEQLAEAGTKVKAGTPIIKIDREFIKSKNLPLVTPILITNPDVVKSMDAKTGLDAKAGETVVLEYSL